MQTAILCGRGPPGRQAWLHRATSVLAELRQLTDSALRAGLRRLSVLGSADLLHM